MFVKNGDVGLVWNKVRLQLEALLAEKSRLANENANLIRENQCLNQLVEYHQLTSQDFDTSYERITQGMCLDFSSPPPTIPEDQEPTDEAADCFQTPVGAHFDFSNDLNDCDNHWGSTLVVHCSGLTSELWNAALLWIFLQNCFILGSEINYHSVNFSSILK